MKWLKVFKHPVKLLLLLSFIGMFVGDVIFTELINPASEWVFNFNIPIINITFGSFSLFVMIIWLVVSKILGNNPDT